MCRLVRMVAVLAVIWGSVVALSSPAQATCGGTGVVEIVSLTFEPPAVAAATLSRSP